MIKNEYIHPKNNLIGKLSNSLFNNHKILNLKPKLFSSLPFPILKSDIENVVYNNWLVDKDAFADFIPESITLNSKNGRILFTVLTYQHTHFGPDFIGIFRQLCPSPLQSNWRLYPNNLPNGNDASKTVLFIKNIIDNYLYAAGSRLFSNALPSHFPQIFEHYKTDTHYFTKIISGQGSSPELHNESSFSSEKHLPQEFHNWFKNWNEAITYICSQNSAIVKIENTQSLAHAGIDLPIDLSTVAPLKTNLIEIPLLKKLNCNPSDPLCFVVPKICFKVLWEKITP